MNKIKSVIILLILFGVVSSYSQWTPIQGINGFSSSNPGSASRVPIDTNADGSIYANSNYLQGRIGIFQLEDNSWKQMGDYIESNEEGISFGVSISLSASGTSIAISSHGEFDFSGINISKAYIYDYIDSQWIQRGQTLSSDQISSSYTGAEIQMSADGNRVIVAEPFHDNGVLDGTFAEPNYGKASVYEWDGTMWVQIGNAIHGEFEDSKLGDLYCISPDGNTIAVSQEENDLDYAKVYRWNGQNYVPFGNKIEANSNNQRFGQNVALSGDGKVFIASTSFEEFSYSRVYEYIESIDDFEPNNTIETASSITCEQFYQPFIQDVGDKDWYSIQMSTSGAISAELTLIPNSIDLNVEIWQVINGQPTLIAQDDDTNSSGGQDITATAFVEAGTYFILVEDELDNSSNDSEPYGLKVACYENNFEINQTIDIASEIPFDTCFKDNIWGENQLYLDSNDGAVDQDWFFTDISESGYLDIAVTFVPADIDINLEIWTIVNGQPVKVSDDDDNNASGGQNVNTTAYLEPGRYYVHIIDELFNNTNDEEYNFCINFYPKNEEINQTFETAAWIARDTCFEDQIWGENELFEDSNTGDNDQDWFKVDIPASGYLDVKLTSVPANIDLNVDIFIVESGQLIKIADDNDTNSNGGQDMVATAFVSPEVYYIHVSDENNNFTTQESYNFCIEFHESALEVNQLIGEATPIPTDTCFEERIWGENEQYLNSNEGDDDLDWYQINLPSGCDLDISVTDVPSTIDINIELYEIVNGQNVLRANDSDGTASNGQNIFLNYTAQPGQYFILVEDENNNATTSEYFTFCISCTGSTNTTDVTTINRSVYPSPTSNLLNIKGGDFIKGEIINTVGNIITIFESKLINVSHLPKGIYHIRIMEQNGQFSLTQFIKI